MDKNNNKSNNAIVQFPSLYVKYFLMDNYPKETFVKLASSFLDGRLTLNRSLPPNGPFMVEVDLIQRESGKIYLHIKTLYAFSDPVEAEVMGLQILSDYLKRPDKQAF